MAPPHSACWPSTTFGFTLKTLSHRPKWGGMRRNASHIIMDAERLRKEFGGKIMKIYSIVEHETADKRMKGKA